MTLVGKIPLHENRDLGEPATVLISDCASAWVSSSMPRQREESPLRSARTIQNNCMWVHIREEAENQFPTWPLISYLALANSVFFVCITVSEYNLRIWCLANIVVGNSPASLTRINSATKRKNKTQMQVLQSMSIPKTHHSWCFE